MKLPKKYPPNPATDQTVIACTGCEKYHLADVDLTHEQSQRRLFALLRRAWAADELVTTAMFTQRWDDAAVLAAAQAIYRRNGAADDLRYIQVTCPDCTLAAIDALAGPRQS